MSGVKGRSGRRPLSVELKRRAVIDKAWDILDHGFDDPHLDLKTKMDKASQLAVKDMPTDLGDQTIGHTQVIIIRDRQQESTDGTPHHSERLSGSLSLVRE